MIAVYHPVRPPNLDQFALFVQPTITSVHSPDNPAFRRLMNLLTSARSRREEGAAVLEGGHLLTAWLQGHGAEVDTLFVDQGAADVPALSALVDRVPARRVLACESRLFKKASPVAGENAVLAIVQVPVVPTAAPQIPGSFEVWLDGIQDPGNAGTLIRSAAGAGAAAVRLGPGCADAWSPKCLRAGMGGHFVLDVEERCDLVARATDPGTRLLAADAATGNSLFEADLTGTIALVLGGEGAGISPDLAACVHQTLRIPMLGGIESLNVAAAGAILCFERVRQALTVPALRPSRPDR